MSPKTPNLWCPVLDTPALPSQPLSFPLVFPFAYKSLPSVASHVGLSGMYLQDKGVKYHITCVSLDEPMFKPLGANKFSPNVSPKIIAKNIGFPLKYSQEVMTVQTYILHELHILEI